MEVEEEVIGAEGDYLNEALGKYTQTKLKVSKWKNADKKASNKLKLDTKVAALKDSMTSFNKAVQQVVILCENEVASWADIRVELSKLECSFTELSKEKVEVVSTVTETDLTEVTSDFEKLVREEFDKCKTADTSS